MNKEFKKGEKVTCIKQGRGNIINISNEIYPIKVDFKNGKFDSYTLNGREYEKDITIMLYHGHGTFKIEFIEDKEPEYEWQWLYKYKGIYETTSYYKTYEEMFEKIGKYNEIVERIEKSKKEVLQ